MEKVGLLVALLRCAKMTEFVLDTEFLLLFLFIA